MRLLQGEKDQRDMIYFESHTYLDTFYNLFESYWKSNQSFYNRFLSKKPCPLKLHHWAHANTGVNYAKTKHSQA